MGDDTSEQMSEWSLSEEEFNKYIAVEYLKI